MDRAGRDGIEGDIPTLSSQATHTRPASPTPRTEWAFTYPSATLGMEVASLFVFGALEWARAVIGLGGNRAGNRARLVEYLVLSLMSLVALLYFLLWQTFV